MILDRYEYKYALIPHKEARKMGLGWRKADQHGMVMMNLSELKQLPGEGTVEEKVEAIGGLVMTPDEAFYYRHTNTFSFMKSEDEPQDTPQDMPQEEQPQQPPVTPDPEEIDPGFTQGGTQTEFPEGGEGSTDGGTTEGETTGGESTGGETTEGGEGSTEGGATEGGTEQPGEDAGATSGEETASAVHVKQDKQNKKHFKA